jgi:hypothetical protein
LFAKFTIPGIYAADKQHGDAFEYLSERSFVYRTHEPSEWRVGRAGRLGGIVVDHDEVKLVAVAKQYPLVTWRNIERIFDCLASYAVGTRMVYTPSVCLYGEPREERELTFHEGARRALYIRRHHPECVHDRKLRVCVRRV